MKEISAPFSIIRSNKVPTFYLKKMSDNRLSDLVIKIEKLESKINDSKNDVIKYLEEKIKEFADRGMSVNFLISLKRKIFNNKKITNEGLTRLKNEYRSIYLSIDYFTNLEKLNNLEETLDSFYNKKIIECREILQDALSNEYMLNGIKFINENIPEFVDRFINMDELELKSHDRKKEANLVKIFLRSATKTSPFSTFTQTSFSSIENEIFLKKEEQILTSINITYLMKIFSCIYHNSNVIDRTPFILNPSLDKVDNYYAYSKLDNSDSNQVFQTRSSLCQIKENVLLNFIFENYKDKDIYYSDINDNISNLSIDIYMKLIDIKFLIPKEYITISKTSLIDNLINFIDRYQLYETEFIGNVKSLLLTIKNDLNEYNQTKIYQVDIRLKKYMCIAKSFEKIFNILGLSGFDSRNIIYEDFIGKASKENTFNINDFSILLDISILFDENVRIQNLIASEFLKHFGNNLVSTDSKEMINLIVSLNSEYNSLWDNEWNDIIDKKNEINYELDLLKSEFVKLVKDNLKRGYIPVNEVKKITSKIPEAIKVRSNSYDLYFQRNSKGEIILNNIYKGYLSYFSRFIDSAIDRNSNPVRKYKDQIYNENNNITAEILEFQGFNANIHELLCDLRFITKGSYDLNNLYGGKKSLEFSSLFYRYDEKEKRLKLTDEKENYRVMFLGNLMPMNLPGIFGIINPLFTSFKMDYSINKLVFNESDVTDIIEIPQFKIGNVILQRKGYIIPRKKLSFVLDANLTPIEKYKLLVNVLNEIGVKKEFFIQGFFGKTFSMVVKENENMDLGKTKPVYIDINNALIMRHLDKLFPDTDFFLIEDCNPYIDDSEYVEEYLIEISRIGE